MWHVVTENKFGKGVGKSDLPIINSVCEKVWFTINGMPKMLFHFIAFFIFPNFKWPLLKLMEKPSFFIIDFEGSNEALLRQKYFRSTYFWQWIDGPIKIFWNFHGDAFCFFIFLNDGNIPISLLMIHLKCTVVHYTNLNSSFVNKPYLRTVEYATSFFLNSYLRLF